MRHPLPALLLVAACGSSGKPSKAACDKAAAQMFKLQEEHTLDDLTDTDEQRQELADRTANAPGAAEFARSQIEKFSLECRDGKTGWSSKEVDCVVNADSWDDVEDCQLP